jgi:phage-related protein
MRSRLAPAEKPLHWVGSSKRDLLDMPEPVVREIGVALSVAQFGSKYPNAKPWKGLGPGVLEIVSDFATDTFRAVYTFRFREAIALLSKEIAERRSAESRRAAAMSSWIWGYRVRRNSLPKCSWQSRSINR